MSTEPVISKEIPELLENHFRQLDEGSGITIDVVRERGYRSIFNKSELVGMGFGELQRRVPGMLIPLHATDGGSAGYTYRPDNPRLDRKGKVIK